MKGHPEFDEVMIINPSRPGLDASQGETTMMGYYAEAPYDGYFADEPDLYDGYSEPLMEDLPEDLEAVYDDEWAAPEMGEWDGSGEYGWLESEYGDDAPLGYWADDYEDVGSYVEDEPYGEYAEDEEDPFGLFAEDDDDFVGYYANDDPYEPVGWAEDLDDFAIYEDSDAEMFAEDAEDFGMEEVDAPEMSAYVRERDPAFNAGCSCPSNVHGLEEEEEFEGYVRPRSVNAACAGFTAQPGMRRVLPETFKPLW